MTIITRRTLLGATAVATLPGPSRAAPQFSYKYGSNLPAAHPLNVRMTEAAARILEESGGRLEIKVFPNNQLGGDTDMLSQLRSGGLEFFTLSGLILATLVPIASINGIGYAFHDLDQAFAAMDGELGAHVRGAISRVGLIAFDRMFDNGFRQTTTSTKPIAAPADFAGLKLRVPSSPLWTSMFKAFGAAPTTINIAETYSALQTHVVEGQENPLAVISTAKFYEVQKYCSMTNHMWDGYWFLANRRAFEALPADLREIATRHVNQAALAERADVRKLNDSLQSDLEAKGLVFNAPDPAPFREALRSAGFYTEWKTKYGPDAWAILNKAAGGLA